MDLFLFSNIIHGNSGLELHPVDEALNALEDEKYHDENAENEVDLSRGLLMAVPFE